MSAATHARRLLKTVHIGFAGVWLGGLVCMGALLLVARADLGGRDPFPLYLAVHTIHDVVLYAAFTGTLTTGLLFSLFTKWGFARHRWIAVKWGLALVLFAVTLVWQAPAIAGAVALADAGPAFSRYGQLSAYADRALLLACIQVAIVAAVFPISTWKPWGRWKRVLRVSARKVRIAVVSLAIIGAGFAVFNFVTLQRYRTMPIPPVAITELPDGSYAGAAACGYEYAVEVGIDGGRVSSIDVTKNRDSHYAQFAEGVLPRIVATQRVEVDAITGATTTSRCLMKAVANALSDEARPAP